MQEISKSRVAVDIIIIIACALPLVAFQKWIKPYQRGFYCNDETIRYPYRDSTVTRHQLVVIGTAVPVLLMVVFECMRVGLWEARRIRAGTYQPQVYRLKNFTLHRLVVRLYIFCGYFALGVCFNQVLTDIAKYTIGRLRPHFIAVCQPESIWEANCPTNQSHRYIDNYKCTGNDEFRITDSHLSFYSGHSSFSFFCAVYTVLYLQARVYRPLHSRIVLPFLQFILLGMACFCAYSRVSDYKHHWEDVLFGSFMGIVVAIYVGVYVAELFQRREMPSEHEGLATDAAAGLVKEESNNDIVADLQYRSNQSPFTDNSQHEMRVVQQRHRPDDFDNGRV
uniref:Phosphatidic acid phosphatase type 2/haloperoxidase domain-containing protein n=1 Tax=Plectus sambesii TaxID=2011161 RepID=A0A914XK94_9BILA